MDRFERPPYLTIFPAPVSVYIPIWIDLKGLDYGKLRGLGQIYIPIWIDLKGTTGN